MIDPELLLADLTEPQKEAVLHVDGPLLIIAGAGSGKTRVITRRVANLLSLGIVPSSILAITFTNKAAGEMKHRISAQMDRPLRDFGRLDQPWPLICTFHSLGMRILKHYAAEAGLSPNFTIFDSSDQERLVKQAIRDADLSTTNFPPSRVHAEISNAKNKLVGAQQYAANARGFPHTHYARAFTAYDKLLKQNGAVDFDDLLLKTAELLRARPEALKALQERFQYLLIDEYQDTNHAQYIVAHALAAKHRNICVVGDPDQSIYAWRGADIQNILDFETDYPDAKVVKLEQNYRSTKTVLELASKLIEHNKKRKKKGLITDNEQGEKARLFVCTDEHAEAQAVARELRRLHEKEQTQWGQMAIFYRINAISRVMEEALRREKIPYLVARGVDFYHRKEIKDALAYLRVVANPDDELSLTRIINVPARGIGESGVKQLQVFALSNQLTLWQALLRCGEVPGLSNRSANGMLAFAHRIKQWRELAANLPADTAEGRVRKLVDSVIRDSGLEAYYKKIDPDQENELSNLLELISSAAEYDAEQPEGSLDDYLAQISLMSDQDMLKEGGGAVTLMTLHAAKGLEFPVVAIVAMEEGALPHARVQEHPEQLEEERRLCFVGITRARRRLIFSHARSRQIRGLTERTIASRFLAEMPVKLIEVRDLSEGEGDGEDEYIERRPARAASTASRFRPGQRVRHPQFGVGTIREVNPMGQQTRLVVEFLTAGKKTLIQEYARLEAL